MATFPRSIASNTNFSAVGPINGQPTKVVPSDAVVANGIVPGVPFGAEHLNSELNGLSSAAAASVHSRLAKFRQVGKNPATAIVTASSFTSAMVSGPSGNIVLLEGGQNYIVAKNGMQTFDLAAGFTGPYAAAESSAGKFVLTAQSSATVQYSATGLSWTNRHTAFTAAGATGVPLAVAANPANSNEFVILDVNGNLYYTTNTGTSFTEFVTGFDTATLPANSSQLCYDAAGNLYVIGTVNPSTRQVAIRTAGAGFISAFNFPAGLATGGATIACGGRTSVPLFSARTTSNQPVVYTISPAGVFTLTATLTVPIALTTTAAPRLIGESRRLNDVTVLAVQSATGGSHFWYNSEAQGNTWHEGGFLPFGGASSLENLAFVNQRLIYVDKSAGNPNVRVYLSDGLGI